MSNHIIELRVQIRDSLTVRAREFNILIDDVAITQLSFGGEVRPPPCAGYRGVYPCMKAQHPRNLGVTVFACSLCCILMVVAPTSAVQVHAEALIDVDVVAMEPTA